jgi:hypothetical protein
MTSDRKFLRPRVFVPLLVLFFAIFFLPGASLYYHYSGGRSCARCHEIWQPYPIGTSPRIATSLAPSVTVT